MTQQGAFRVTCTWAVRCVYRIEAFAETSLLILIVLEIYPLHLLSVITAIPRSQVFEVWTIGTYLIFQLFCLCEKFCMRECEIFF